MQLQLLTVLLASISFVANAAHVVQISSENDPVPRTLLLSPDRNQRLFLTTIRSQLPEDGSEKISTTYFRNQAAPTPQGPVVRVAFRDGTYGYGHIRPTQGHKRISKLMPYPTGRMATSEELSNYFKDGPSREGQSWDASPRYPIADAVRNLATYGQDETYPKGGRKV